MPRLHLTYGFAGDGGCRIRGHLELLAHLGLEARLLFLLGFTEGCGDFGEDGVERPDTESCNLIISNGFRSLIRVWAFGLRV